MTPPSAFRLHPSSNGTLLEAVLTSLAHAARFNPGDVVAPAAVLWTDADGQWRPVVEKLRAVMPELLTLGEYDAATRTGPAIWLRTVIEPAVRADKFPDLTWPDGAAPVIYMPEVSRQTLRAVEECPDALKPLVELQYRGAIWTQKGGKDWTIRGFLVNDEEGLGLDVAEDKLTLHALQGALSRLAVTSVERLRGKRLRAEDFDKLMIGDTPRDLLLWLGDPDGTRDHWDDGTWAAFCNRCRQDYGFDPEADGQLVGGEKLGARKDAWYGVWERFAESPALYPGVPDLLRRAKPAALEFFADKDPWPDENEAKEGDLRATLLEIGSAAAGDARKRVKLLEAEHGVRRSWVWAKLGQTPLANALEHLAGLADRTASSMGGGSPEEMAKLFTEGAYLADDAVLRALASVRTSPDTEAVHAAVRCIYLPWLEDASRRFQQCIDTRSLPLPGEQKSTDPGGGECLLFSDGLRYDLGQRLIATAGARQLDVTSSWRWSALPTVTSTSKPAVSPVLSLLGGKHPGTDFSPVDAATGDRITTDRFRRLLGDAGYQVIGKSETGSPTADARAWTEFGQLDKLGHDLQSKLADSADEQLESLMERVQELLDAGWRRVRVVTDHGWLLVPGGLPKADLPKYLTESRWSRCASITDRSQVAVPVAGWSWNPQEWFAMAPGAHCFVAGQEFAHGGASLQECVLPVITFAAPAMLPGLTTSIREIQWTRLRCRISVEPVTAGYTADLRTRPNDPESSIASPKPLDEHGKASLLVADEAHEEAAVSVVILDSSGRVICREATIVGGDK